MVGVYPCSSVAMVNQDGSTSNKSDHVTTNLKKDTSLGDVSTEIKSLQEVQTSKLISHILKKFEKKINRKDLKELCGQIKDGLPNAKQKSKLTNGRKYAVEDYAKGSTSYNPETKQQSPTLLRISSRSTSRKSSSEVPSCSELFNLPKPTPKYRNGNKYSTEESYEFEHDIMDSSTRNKPKTKSILGRKNMLQDSCGQILNSVSPTPQVVSDNRPERKSSYKMKKTSVAEKEEREESQAKVTGDGTKENLVQKRIFQLNKLQEKAYCRLCGKEKEARHLQPLFSDKAKETDLVTKVVRTCGVDIKENDPLPKMICRVCEKFVVKMSEYRKMCQKTQLKFSFDRRVMNAPRLALPAVPNVQRADSTKEMNHRNNSCKEVTLKNKKSKQRLLMPNEININVISMVTLNSDADATTNNSDRIGDIPESVYSFCHDAYVSQCLTPDERQKLMTCVNTDQPSVIATTIMRECPSVVYCIKKGILNSMNNSCKLFANQSNHSELHYNSHDESNPFNAENIYREIRSIIPFFIDILNTIAGRATDFDDTSNDLKIKYSLIYAILMEVRWQNMSLVSRMIATLLMKGNGDIQLQCNNLCKDTPKKREEKETENEKDVDTENREDLETYNREDKETNNQDGLEMDSREGPKIDSREDIDTKNLEDTEKKNQEDIEFEILENNLEDMETEHAEDLEIPSPNEEKKFTRPFCVDGKFTKFNPSFQRRRIRHSWALGAQMLGETKYDQQDEEYHLFSADQFENRVSFLRISQNNSKADIKLLPRSLFDDNDVDENANKDLISHIFPKIFPKDVIRNIIRGNMQVQHNCQPDLHDVQGLSNLQLSDISALQAMCNHGPYSSNRSNNIDVLANSSLNDSSNPSTVKPNGNSKTVTTVSVSNMKISMADSITDNHQLDENETTSEKRATKPNMHRSTSKPKHISPKQDTNTSKPRMNFSTKPSKPLRILPKPDVTLSKPRFNVPRPEISAHKPKVIVQRPELPSYKPRVMVPRQEFTAIKPRSGPVISKPKIITSKPRMCLPKPQVTTATTATPDVTQITEGVNVEKAEVLILSEDGKPNEASAFQLMKPEITGSNIETPESELTITEPYQERTVMEEYREVLLAEPNYETPTLESIILESDTEILESDRPVSEPTQKMTKPDPEAKVLMSTIPVAASNDEITEPDLDIAWPEVPVPEPIQDIITTEADTEILESEIPIPEPNQESNIFEPEMKSLVSELPVLERNLTMATTEPYREIFDAGLPVTNLNEEITLAEPDMKVDDLEVPVPEITQKEILAESEKDTFISEISVTELNEKITLSEPDMDIFVSEIPITELDQEITIAEPEVDIFESEILIPERKHSFTSLVFQLEKLLIFRKPNQNMVSEPYLENVKSELSFPEPSMEIPIQDMTISEPDLESFELDISFPESDIDIPTHEIPVSEPDLEILNADVSFPESNNEIPIHGLTITEPDLEIFELEESLQQPNSEIQTQGRTTSDSDLEILEMAITDIEIKFPDLESEISEPNEVFKGIECETESLKSELLSPKPNIETTKTGELSTHVPDTEMLKWEIPISMGISMLESEILDSQQIIETPKGYTLLKQDEEVIIPKQNIEEPTTTQNSEKCETKPEVSIAKPTIATIETIEAIETIENMEKQLLSINFNTNDSIYCESQLSTLKKNETQALFDASSCDSYGPTKEFNGPYDEPVKVMMTSYPTDVVLETESLVAKRQKQDTLVTIEVSCGDLIRAKALKDKESVMLESKEVFVDVPHQMMCNETYQSDVVRVNMEPKGGSLGLSKVNVKSDLLSAPPSMEKSSQTDYEPSEKILEDEISLSVIYSSEERFSSERRPSAEIFSSETQPSEDTSFLESQLSEEISAAETLPSAETFSSETQPSEDTSFLESQLSEEISSSETLPSEETFSSSSQPSEETFFLENQPSEDTSFLEGQLSEDTSFLESQPSEDTSFLESQPSEEISLSETLPSEKTFSSENQPSEETSFLENQPSEDTSFLEGQLSEDISSSETQPSAETFSSETQPSEDTSFLESQLSEEISSSETLPSEETFSSESQPSEETSFLESQPSEDTFFLESQPSEDTSFLESQPSEDTSFLESQPSEEISSSETLPSEETFSSENQPSEETSFLESQPSEDTSFLESKPSEEKSLPKSQSSEETKPRHQSSESRTKNDTSYKRESEKMSNLKKTYQDAVRKITTRKIYDDLIIPSSDSSKRRNEMSQKIKFSFGDFDMDNQVSNHNKEKITANDIKEIKKESNLVIEKVSEINVTPEEASFASKLQMFQKKCSLLDNSTKDIKKICKNESSSHSNSLVVNSAIKNSSIENSPIANSSIENSQITNLSIESSPITNLSIENSPNTNLSIENSPNTSSSIENSPITSLSVENSSIKTQSKSDKLDYISSVMNFEKRAENNNKLICLGDDPSTNQDLPRSIPRGLVTNTRKLSPSMTNRFMNDVMSDVKIVFVNTELMMATLEDDGDVKDWVINTKKTPTNMKSYDELGFFDSKFFYETPNQYEPLYLEDADGLKKKEKKKSNRKPLSAESKHKMNRLRKKNKQEKKKFVYIIGDSMLRTIRGLDLKRKLNTIDSIFVRCYPGATTSDMERHSRTTMEKNPSCVILHCGTNDLPLPNTPKQIAINIVELASLLRNECRDIMISGIIPRRDRWDVKRQLVNMEVRNKAAILDLAYRDHNNIDKEKDLDKGGVNLNTRGTNILFQNFVETLQTFKWSSLQ